VSLKILLFIIPEVLWTNFSNPPPQRRRQDSTNCVPPPPHFLPASFFQPVALQDSERATDFLCSFLISCFFAPPPNTRPLHWFVRPLSVILIFSPVSPGPPPPLMDLSFLHNPSLPLRFFSLVSDPTPFQPPPISYGSPPFFRIILVVYPLKDITILSYIFSLPSGFCLTRLSGAGLSRARSFFSPGQAALSSFCPGNKTPPSSKRPFLLMSGETFFWITFCTSPPHAESIFFKDPFPPLLLPP